MSKLIINADDFGFSKAVNYAIVDAHKDGILTSTTLMVNTPAFKHAVELAKINQDLGIGIHLVLTFSKPLIENVKSLVDDNGNFYKAFVYSQENIQVDESELYNEWDAQINKAIDAGIKPTHLDAHQHSNTFSDTHLKVFLDLANKYDLPVRNNFNYSKELYPKVVTTEYFETAFDSIGNLTLEDQGKYFDKVLEKIRNNETTEIMCHPGYLDNYVLDHTTYTFVRLYQVDLLTDSPLVDRIKNDKSIKLTTFSELK